jgi:hypothetical protein
MRLVSGSTLCAALALLGCSFAGGSAGAAGFDGSKDFLCAPTDVAECDAAARCERVSPSEVDLPAFLRVSVGKKRISNIEPPERSTVIENVRSVDGATILQGAENGRAWSMVIDQQTGKLSGSIAEGAGAFVVFGSCTLR